MCFTANKRQTSEASCFFHVEGFHLVILSVETCAWVLKTFHVRVKRLWEILPTITAVSVCKRVGGSGPFLEQER